MRSYNVLLLIVLVTFSFSNAFEFTNLAEVKQLRSNSYGNSLIETISLTLQSAGSIDEVKRLLVDLLFKLNTDQENSDKEWNKTNSTLSEKINTLTSEITNLNTQITLDQAEQKTFEGKRDQAKTNIDQYTAQRNQNMDSLKANSKRRENDIAAIKASIQDHNDVVNAIAEVVKEISKLKDSISGQGKPAHVEEIAAETRDREYKAGLKSSFVQLTKDQTEAMLLVELATSADQAALVKLIGLLTDLSNATKKSLNDDEAAEASSKTTFETLEANLKADNLKLDDMLKEQNTNLKNYEAKITELVEKIANQQKLVTSKTAEKNDTIKIRAEKETQYNQDKAERSKEKEVIIKLQKIVNERLENMSKFLKSQTGAF